LGRLVKHYIAQLEQCVALPDHERPNDATLAEWIRHCKRAGLYEQGNSYTKRAGSTLKISPKRLWLMSKRITRSVSACWFALVVLALRISQSEGETHVPDFH
jgi:hypothetical protein